MRPSPAARSIFGSQRSNGTSRCCSWALRPPEPRPHGRVRHFALSDIATARLTRAATPASASCTSRPNAVSSWRLPRRRSAPLSRDSSMNARPPIMNPELLQECTQALETERARLEAELTSFATKDPKMKDDWDATFPGSAPGSDRPDEEEQADIREEYETELASEQGLEGRLRNVRRALERITAGTYGRCAKCGEPIPEERLRANPAAAYDIT